VPPARAAYRFRKWPEPETTIVSSTKAATQSTIQSSALPS
jgi:hypothetical protein